MSEAMKKASTETLQCVTFRLDAETYAIDVMQVREVLRTGEIVPVPGSPPFVLGIINLRGNVVTVMDARMRFGLEPCDVGDTRRIVIIESGDQIMGIQVDSVAEVIEIPVAEMEPAPAVGNDESHCYIQGVVSRDEDLVIVVDLNRLLSEEEWEQLVTA